MTDGDEFCAKIKNYYRLCIKFKIARYHFAANLSGSPHLIRHLFVCFLPPRNKLKKGTLFSAFCPEAISSKKLPFQFAVSGKQAVVKL